MQPVNLPPLTEEQIEHEIQRVKKNRARLYTEAPGTYMMMAGLPIEAETQIGTFATDGKKVLVNIRWCMSLSDFEIRAILIHESLHISLKHMFRRGELHPDLWNEATDYVINGWIMQSENYGSTFILPPGCLVDQKYWGWSAEKVAKDMLDNGWEPKPPPPPGEGPCRPGDVLDSPLEEGETMEEAEAELDERIADASLLEKSCGQGSAGIVTQIKEHGYNTTSPERIRHFLKTTYSSIRKSMARPNRRFVWQNIYLPTSRKQQTALHCFIDSSASVGSSELSDYQGSVVRFASELGLSLIRVAYIDWDVHKNKETGDIWFDIHLNHGVGAEEIELKVIGGGGTSFDPGFRAVEESGEDISALVYFTDGYGSVSIPDPGYPVLWVSSGTKPTFVNEEFGDVVYINRY